jgi:agmatinase
MLPRRLPNFLELAPEASDPGQCGVVILPLPLDLTASWQRGTGGGPAAIIAASHHIELFDEELGFELPTAAGGIATLSEPRLPSDPALATRAVEELASGLVSRDRLLLSLGGEHSLTYPLVAAHRRLWPELAVLQIDAHADMRSSYQGTPFNHACPMRRVMELGTHVTSVGVRSMEAAESEFLASARSRIFLAAEVVGRLTERAEEIVASIPGREVYLTIDLDGLDPAVVPAVGTPVPGGLGWYETLTLLRVLARERCLIGADVVELAPRSGLHCADAAAARLACKVIGYWAEGRGRRGQG